MQATTSPAILLLEQLAFPHKRWSSSAGFFEESPGSPKAGLGTLGFTARVGAGMTVELDNIAMVVVTLLVVVKLLVVVELLVELLELLDTCDEGV